MSKAARFISTSLLACLLASLAWGGPENPLRPSSPAVFTVAYVPGGDGPVDEALLVGMREVFAATDAERARIRLEVGRRPQTWSNAAPEAVRLLFESKADVLVAPPDRRVAHLMAQVATRVQVPLVSTSDARTVGATGSHWVRVVPREAGPDTVEAKGAAPDRDWVAVGRQAALASLAAIEARRSAAR